MCDKHSFRAVLDKMNKHEQVMMREASAYDRFMKKQKDEDITMWFTEQHCSVCESPIYTNGKLYWCKEGCINNGRRRTDDKDYMKFIKENAR